VARPFEQSLPGTALITGIDGFTGGYVAEELRAAGFRVVGTSHEREAREEHIYQVDLMDEAGLISLVSAVSPNIVIHLAAISFVAHGSADIVYRTNIVGTRNLLSALAQAKKRPDKVIIASSANVYGNAGSDYVTEDFPFKPANDYAVSKVAMEYMARLWGEDLPLVVSRPFNYTGVGQGSQFLIPKIVMQYRRRELHIELGNLDVVRDFLDVRDVAKAYLALVEYGMPGLVYNICSGRGYSLASIIDTLSHLAGYCIEVHVNQNFVRKNEIRTLVGSNDRLLKAAPYFDPRPLDETLRWMYENGCGALQ
jgi:nucleoside-diphosphate-sugar epimerase